MWGPFITSLRAVCSGFGWKDLLYHLTLVVTVSERATVVVPTYQHTSHNMMTLRLSSDPFIEVREICCFINLCLFESCLSPVVWARLCLCVCVLELGCVRACMRVCVCVWERETEQESETDSYDSYFNLFWEYCCTGAVHWVTPACQVCLIMQKEQKNALQMSDCLPIETEIWQTPWTLREQ